jgi:hypothetical protein
MRPEDIVAALLRLDASCFTAEQLNSLAGAVPSEEERDALARYAAGKHPASPGHSSPEALGDAERFLALLAGVPQVKERIAALSFCSLAQSTMDKVQVSWRCCC